MSALIVPILDCQQFFLLNNNRSHDNKNHILDKIVNHFIGLPPHSWLFLGWGGGGGGVGPR